MAKARRAKSEWLKVKRALGLDGCFFHQSKGRVIIFKAHKGDCLKKIINCSSDTFILMSQIARILG